MVRIEKDGSVWTVIHSRFVAGARTGAGNRTSIRPRLGTERARSVNVRTTLVPATDSRTSGGGRSGWGGDPGRAATTATQPSPRAFVAGGQRGAPTQRCFASDHACSGQQH